MQTLRSLRAYFAILSAGFALCGLSTFSARAGAADGKIDVYWVDVEGGGGTLIVTPAGESVMIDTGAGARDAGRIAEVAKIAGLKQIDFLITTHYDIDHMGGAAPLAALIPIKNIYDNADKNVAREKQSQAYKDIKADKRILINPGDELPLKQAEGDKAMAKIILKCLAARKTFIDAPAGAKENPFAKDAREKPVDATDNANSVVMLLSFGDFRFFDGGDLTWNIEKDLVTPLNRVGIVDVYQTDHHGLARSGNPVLVKVIEPTVSVMNNAGTKGTEAETMETLRATPSIQAMFQLHKNTRADGNVNNTKDEFIANFGGQSEGNYIKMSVEPDGKKYTISIPATKFEKTFETKKK